MTKFTAVNDIFAVLRNYVTAVFLKGHLTIRNIAAELGTEENPIIIQPSMEPRHHTFWLHHSVGSYLITISLESCTRVSFP